MQFSLNLFTFTKEIFNRKFYFLCGDWQALVYFDCQTVKEIYEPDRIGTKAVIRRYRLQNRCLFYCDFCEIFKSTYFLEHLRTVTSVGILQDFFLMYFHWDAFYQFKSLTQVTFTCSMSTIGTLENGVWNMLKLNNKYIRMTSLTSSQLSNLRWSYVACCFFN